MAKSKEVKFRLTEQELETANQLAEKYGMSVNALAKFMVLNLEAPATKTDREFMKDLNAKMGRIGNNLNQIARRLNQTDSLTPSERASLLVVLTSLDRQLGDLLEQNRDR